MALAVPASFRSRLIIVKSEDFKKSNADFQYVYTKPHFGLLPPVTTVIYNKRTPLRLYYACSIATIRGYYHVMLADKLKPHYITSIQPRELDNISKLLICDAVKTQIKKSRTKWYKLFRLKGETEVTIKCL